MGTARDTLARAGVNPRDLAGFGITNQRETAVSWQNRDGLHLAWRVERTFEPQMR